PTPDFVLCPAAAELAAFNLDTQFLSDLQRVTESKTHSLEHRLEHVHPRGACSHSNKGASCVNIVQGRSLSHKIWQEIYSIFSQPLFHSALLSREVISVEHVIHK